MKAVIRALIGLLALSVCLVVAAPSAAARTLPVVPAVTAVTAVAGATAQSELPAWPVIRQGSFGQPVRSLQYLLNARGAGLVVDGIFGPRTNMAPRNFQSTHGLVVDGIVGPQTWRSVIITVRYGSVGSAVKAVQDQANFRGGRGEGPARALRRWHLRTQDTGLGDGHPGHRGPKSTRASWWMALSVR